MNENIVKAGLIFGGGFILFWLVKPKNPLSQVPAASPVAATKSFDSTPSPDPKNIDIVGNAYAAALNAGEPPSVLAELNKEMIKEFGMRAYMDKQTNNIVVTDVKGNAVSK